MLLSCCRAYHKKKNISATLYASSLCLVDEFTIGCVGHLDFIQVNEVHNRLSARLYLGRASAWTRKLFKNVND